MSIYGYIRTSQKRVAGQPGMNPATQERQLLEAGVPQENIIRDLAVSGTTHAMGRRGWKHLDALLRPSDTLIAVSVDRIGRNWLDGCFTMRGLRSRGVKVKTLAESEQAWNRYFFSEDTLEAMIGDVLCTFLLWQSEQEYQSIRRRIKAGMDRAKSEGKSFGPKGPTSGQLEQVRRMRQDEGMSLNKIAAVFGVTRPTVANWLKKVEG